VYFWGIGVKGEELNEKFKINTGMMIVAYGHLLNLSIFHSYRYYYQQQERIPENYLTYRKQILGLF